MGFLDGKRALVAGVASNRSIAWGIAQALHRQGAELAFTYQNERLAGRVAKLAAELGSDVTFACDVASDEAITGAFEQLGARWERLDILVHAIAFAPREALEGDFVTNTSRESFRLAHEVSSYSFSAMARAARPMMRGRDAALLTLTYLGAERAMPNYNVMGLAKASLEANVRYMAHALGPDGIRVNAISAGPIRTLAAAGIAGFRDFLEYAERSAPLRRNVGIDEVGDAAAFLCSDLGRAVTGEVLHVDAGFHIVGMGPAGGNGDD